VTDDPTHHAAERVGLLLAVRRYQEALDLVDDALRVDPSNGHMLRIRTHLLQVLDRPIESLDTANALIALDPTDAAGHSAAASALLSLPGGALSACDAAYRAVTLDPTDDYGWLQLVQAQLALGHRREALQTAEQMRGQVPNATNTAIAVSTAALSNRPDKIGLFVLVLLIMSGMIVHYAIYTVIRQRSNQRRLTEADQLLRERLRDDPESAPLLSLLGKVSDARGRVNQGLRYSVETGRRNPYLASAERVHRGARSVFYWVAGSWMVVWCVVAISISAGLVQHGPLGDVGGLFLVMAYAFLSLVIAGAITRRAVAVVPDALRAGMQRSQLRATLACAIAAPILASVVRDERDQVIRFNLIAGVATSAKLLGLALVLWLQTLGRPEG